MNHEEKVAVLLEEFKKIKGNVVLEKNTSNLFRPLEKAEKKLNVRSFTDILSVSKEGIADVEGMVTMENLAKETLKHGFVPQVTIELKTITVGGAVSGIAIESSSFKHGLFHETVLEMEVLVPSGEIVVCSRTNNSDLFYALPNSYGTLGYILRLKIKLMKSKKYVHTAYTQYTNIKKYLEDIGAASLPNEDYDFVEGVVFSKNKMVISKGVFSDEAPYVNDYTYLKKYYKSLETRSEDYLSTNQYLFRWDTDWWWGTQQSPWRFTIVRLLLGKLFLNSKSHMKIMRAKQQHEKIQKNLKHKTQNKEWVIQDIGIPKENWEQYLNFLLDEIKILPIWLCPFKESQDFVLFPLEKKQYIDFGFWGIVDSKEEPDYWNKLAEKKTFEMKGVKSLYSDVTYTEDEFWKNSNKTAYDAVKKKYDPESRLKGLYEKVTSHRR